MHAAALRVQVGPSDAGRSVDISASIPSIIDLTLQIQCQSIPTYSWHQRTYSIEMSLKQQIKTEKAPVIMPGMYCLLWGQMRYYSSTITGDWVVKDLYS